MIPKFRIFDKQKKQMVESAWWEFYFEDERLLTVTSDSGVSYHDYELGEVWELIQSTGLHDKNGKEIFEGDIIGSEDINAHDWKVSLHQIVKRDCGLVGKQICSNGSYIGIEHWTTGKNPFVVVGNIHEHPELLIQPNK